MNIHPLFVHFPIGLLVVYSILEIAAYYLPILRRQTWVSSVKVFLLFVGVIAALIAIVTGGIAEELIETSEASSLDVVEMHSSFAVATTFAYLILVAAYLVRIFDQKGWGDRIVGANNFLISIWNFKKHFWHFILDTWLLPFFALLALVGITITGALGASVVYGPNVDPFVSFIYHFFLAQ